MASYNNESGLELDEQKTATQGYTEVNVAAFAMLGRRVCGVQHGGSAGFYPNYDGPDTD